MAVVIYRMCDGLCVLADGRSVVRYCCRDQSPNRVSCGLQMSWLQVGCPVGLYLGLGLHS